jgi:hypothetical protein
MNNFTNTYLSLKDNQIKKNSYNIDNNNIKYLTLFACNCDSNIKLATIKNNIKYLNFFSMDVILINSSNLPFNSKIQQLCLGMENVKYVEIPNNCTLDFGKWVHCLNNFDYTIYKYIVFINDSFIIHNPITFYFNLAFKKNVELFGYNSSTQLRYHYQSYLFILRNDAIYKFINNFNSKKQLINNQNDVINFYELNMTDWFDTKDCFLDIGFFIQNKYKNIFFTNDKLYNILKIIKLLPFTKIKRILQKNKTKKRSFREILWKR